MVECELEKDPKFKEWIEKQVGAENYKALPAEVCRGWREQYRRDHGIPTSAEVTHGIIERDRQRSQKKG